MPSVVSTVDELVFVTASILPIGHANAISGADLASDLGVTERTVRALVGELIDRGYLVGSVSSGQRPGYFLMEDLGDLNVGTAHLRSRAMSLLSRYRRVRAQALERFGPEALQLFDLDEVSTSG